MYSSEQRKLRTTVFTYRELHNSGCSAQPDCSEAANLHLDLGKYSTFILISERRSSKIATLPSFLDLAATS